MKQKAEIVLNALLKGLTIQYLDHRLRYFDEIGLCYEIISEKKGDCTFKRPATKTDDWKGEVIAYPGDLKHFVDIANSLSQDELFILTSSAASTRHKKEKF